MKQFLLIQLTLFFFTACKEKKNESTGEKIKNTIEKKLDERFEAVIPDVDEVFIIEMNQQELFIVELAKASLKNSKSEEIIDFTQRLIRQHLEINQMLESIGKLNHLHMTDSLEMLEKVKAYQLYDFKGKEFDEQFLETLIKYYNKNIKGLEKQQKKSDNKELKKWIENTLPVFNNQLNEAKNLKDKFYS